MVRSPLGNIGRYMGSPNPNGIRIWTSLSLTRYPPPGGIALPALIIDEHGCVFGEGGSSSTFLSSRTVVAWQTAPAFPRRAKRVGVRIYAMNTLAGELM